MPKHKGKGGAGRRNTKARQHGTSSGSGTQPCPKAKLVVTVEFSDTTGLDGVRIRIAGTTLVQTTAGGGTATFENAPLGSKDVVIDTGDVDRLHARVASLEEIPVVLRAGQVERVRFAVDRRELALTSVDPRFAPGVEKLGIRYGLRAMAEKTVTLRIVGHGDELLHELALSDKQKQTGTDKLLEWTGEITKGAKRGRYACPLDGPFEVQLQSPGWTTQKLSFDIVYAKLELELAPWAELYQAHTKQTDLAAPKGDAAKLRAWVAYKLNELGFWAGPPDGTNNDDLKRAIRCFRLAHPKLCGFDGDRPFYERVETLAGKEMVLRADDLSTIDKDLQTQLEAGTTAGIVGRTALSNPAAIAKASEASKLLVDNSRFFISERTEFGSVNNPLGKFTAEQAWLGRPHVPIRCVVKLLDKQGRPTRAPLAVGQVPILWTWEDVPEADLRAAKLAPALPAYRPDAPSRVADYVADTQTKTKPGTRNGVPKTHGGILDGTDDDAVAPLVASRDLHHAVTAKRAVGMLTRASVDPDRAPVRGAPVIYLATSNIAGDSYRVTAKLHLDDEPNAQALAGLHAGVAAARSGLLAVWRRIRVAAYVAWPKRDGFTLGDELAKVEREFDPCLVELDVTAVEELEAQDLFDDTTFGALLDDAKIGDDETDEYLEAVKLRQFSKDSVYPGDPEECESTFDAFVNQLVPGDSPFARKLAEAWRTHGQDADVRAAGEHLVAALPVAPLVPVTRSTAKVTAAQAEELLLPKPIRDELEAYAAGRSFEAANTGQLQEHLRGQQWTTDKLFAELLTGLLTAVASRGRFKEDVAELFRADPLDLRKWVIRRRVGRLAGNINARLAEQTDMLVRKHLAAADKACDGAILLDYATSEPATIRGEPFVVDGVAFGGLNGVALLDQGLKSAFYSLAAHELGHCMFLLHWRNAPSAVAANHDQADDNCMMSYPVYYTMSECGESDRAAFLRRQYQGSVHSTKAHYCYDKLTPHYCGKCNLQIRGWKLDGGVPIAAPTRVAVAPQHAVTVKLVRDVVGLDLVSADYAADDITTIGVSFYPPHTAGSQSAAHKEFKLAKLADFPRRFGDSLEAALDPGTFRVEVHDPNIAASVVYVTLEALRPTYSGGTVNGWTEFSGEERKRRALVDVECAPIDTDPHTYRSRYLRLVVDEYDHRVLAGTKQGLLVTDMVTATSTTDEDEVEILDQKIRVWYDPA